MNNKMRTVVFSVTFTLFASNSFGSVSESMAVRCPIPITDRINKNNDDDDFLDDALDVLGDQELARGHKPPISSTGLLGWLAMQTRRAGSSLVLTYIAAQGWFGWFRLKTIAAWLWLKNRVNPT